MLKTSNIEFSKLEKLFQPSVLSFYKQEYSWTLADRMRFTASIEGDQLRFYASFEYKYKDAVVDLYRYADCLDKKYLLPCKNMIQGVLLDPILAPDAMQRELNRKGFQHYTDIYTTLVQAFKKARSNHKKILNLTAALAHSYPGACQTGNQVLYTPLHRNAPSITGTVDPKTEEVYFTIKRLPHEQAQALLRFLASMQQE